MASAFFFSNNALVTAAHVVESFNIVGLKLNGYSDVLGAKVTFIKPEYDIAFLEVAADKEGEPLQLLENGSLRIGDDLLIVGFPLGSNKLTFHHGYISAIGPARDFPAGKLEELRGDCPLIQIDATINEGFSGGPVFHLQTEKVCGFITSKYGLLRDLRQLRESIEQLLQHPLTQTFRTEGAGVVISGVDFGKLVTFILDSLEVLLRNLRILHVGIGYAVSSDIFSRLTRSKL